VRTNSSNTAAVAVGIVFVLVLLVVGFFGLRYWSASQLSTTKSELASGYNAHALSAPFVLTSHTWQPKGGFMPTSGTWQYKYTANVSGSMGVADIKNQLAAADGYQVVATSPDAIGSSSSTLYRDLITGDDALQIDVSPASGGTYAEGPVHVTVVLSPLAGQ
jgi:hypothetical protein